MSENTRICGYCIHFSPSDKILAVRRTYIRTISDLGYCKEHKVEMKNTDSCFMWESRKGENE